MTVGSTNAHGVECGGSGGLQHLDRGSPDATIPEKSSREIPPTASFKHGKTGRPGAEGGNAVGSTTGATVTAENRKRTQKKTGQGWREPRLPGPEAWLTRSAGLSVRLPTNVHSNNRSIMVRPSSATQRIGMAGEQGVASGRGHAQRARGRDGAKYKYRRRIQSQNDDSMPASQSTSFHRPV